MDKVARGNLTESFREGHTSFLLSDIPSTQLLSFAVYIAGINGQLVANDGFTARASCEFNASDLRW
jgi:hypothetical protein